MSESGHAYPEASVENTKPAEPAAPPTRTDEASEETPPPFPGPREETRDGQGVPTGPGSHPPRRMRGIGIAVIVALLVLLLVGLVPHLLRGTPQSQASATAGATVTVTVSHPQRPPQTSALVLPGSIEAEQQISVAARGTGYVGKILVDIGDHVKAGQILAVLETPDVLTTLQQSQAALTASRLSLIATRDTLAGDTGALAQQEANLEAMRNTVAEQQANYAHDQAAVVQARAAAAQAKAQVSQAAKVVDQEQAQLKQAQANLDLARITADRYKELLAKGAIDRQTTDQQVAAYQTNLDNVAAITQQISAAQASVTSYQAAYEAALANIKAIQQTASAGLSTVRTAENNVQAAQASVSMARSTMKAGEANVQTAAQNVSASQSAVAHNSVLEDFRNVVSPISGVVTARDIDVGDLVSAGGGSSASATLGNSQAGVVVGGSAAGGGGTGGSGSTNSSTSASGSTGGASSILFSIARTDSLHIYVNVPQSNASSVVPGMTASLAVPQLPDEVFTATVTHIAGALDPVTRTLVVELSIPNPAGELRPGQFAEVTFNVPPTPGVLLVPDAALVTGQNGTQAIIVTPQNKLHFVPVSIGEDDGKNIQITSGLARRQLVVDTPTNAMVEGETVKPVLLKHTRGGQSGSQAGAGPAKDTPMGAMGGPPTSSSASGPAAGAHHKHRTPQATAQ